jgi:hypothetical protein
MCFLKINVLPKSVIEFITCFDIVISLIKVLTVRKELKRVNKGQKAEKNHGRY